MYSSSQEILVFWNLLLLKSVRNGCATLFFSLISESVSKYPGTSTKIHSIDFSQNDELAYDAMTVAFSGLDIGVLGARRIQVD